MSRSRLVVGALLCIAFLPAFSAVEQGAAAIAEEEGERFPIRGFVLEGNDSVATSRIQAALSGSLGERQAAGALLQARDAVYRVYREAGYEMVSVELPARIGLDGIVRLRVRETPIGRITVTGNQHYADGHFRSALPSLQEGRSPNLAALARELFLANDHAGHRVALAFTRGAQGDADVAIKVSDEDPLRVAVSVDNTGTHVTGRARATVTAAHANLWERGHEGVVGYTTSPRFPSRVQQLVLSYQAPLPALGTRLQLGATYSNADAGRVPMRTPGASTAAARPSVRRSRSRQPPRRTGASSPRACSMAASCWSGTPWTRPGRTGCWRAVTTRAAR